MEHEQAFTEIISLMQTLSCALMNKGIDSEDVPGLYCTARIAQERLVDLSRAVLKGAA